MGSEVIGELLADERTAHMLVTGSATEREPTETSLGRKEWFGAHVMTFFIGVWNLFAIDLAHTPGEWWFWIPAMVWAAFLALHATWLVWSGRRPVPSTPAVSSGEVAR